MKKLIALVVWSLFALPTAVAFASHDGGTTVAIGDAGIKVISVVPVVQDPSNASVYAKSIYTAVTTGNWRGAAALLLIGLVWMIRKYGADLWPSVTTDRGGAMLSLSIAVLGSVANALAGGVLTWGTIYHGVVTGIWAAGGFNLFTRIVTPDNNVKASS